MKYKIKQKILSDDEYEEFIPTWIESFSLALKASWPNKELTAEKIEIGILDALNVSLSVIEIYDYFSISYPGILHQATPVEIEQDKIFELFELKIKEITKDLESAQQSDASETMT